MHFKKNEIQIRRILNTQRFHRVLCNYGGQLGSPTQANLHVHCTLENNYLRYLGQKTWYVFLWRKISKILVFHSSFFWNSNAKYLWFLELPKLWSRITDRMILFWYDSLKEENYTCMKMLRHSVLFLVNGAICWWQSMHFYGAKIPIIGLYHRARTETDTEFKLISVLVFHTC